MAFMTMPGKTEEGKAGQRGALNSAPLQQLLGKSRELLAQPGAARETFTEERTLEMGLHG